MPISTFRKAATFRRSSLTSRVSSREPWKGVRKAHHNRTTDDLPFDDYKEVVAHYEVEALTMRINRADGYHIGDKGLCLHSVN